MNKHIVFLSQHFYLLDNFTIHKVSLYIEFDFEFPKLRFIYFSQVVTCHYWVWRNIQISSR